MFFIAVSTKIENDFFGGGRYAYSITSCAIAVKEIVTERANGLCLFFGANRALTLFGAFCGASGSLGFCPLTPCVTESRNYGDVFLFATSCAMVRLATVLGAGGLLVNCPLGFKIMVENTNRFGFSRNFITAFSAFNNEVIATFFGAGSVYFVFLYCFCGSVIELTNGFGFSRTFIATLRTVNNEVVATFFGAGSGNFVLFYCLGEGMGCGNSIILVRFATCAGVGSIAFCGAGGGCYNGFVRMLVTVVYGTAINADVVIIVVVVLCGNVNSFLVIANRALTGLCAFFFASGLFYDVPIAPGVSDFFGRFRFSRNLFCTNRAVNYAIVAAGCDTCGTDFVFFYCSCRSVLEFVDCFGFSRNFLGFTYGTVNNEVVAAFLGAGSGNFVFFYCLGGSVSEFVDCFGLSRKLVAALRAVNNAFVATLGRAGSTNFVFSYCFSAGVLAGGSFCFA